MAGKELVRDKFSGWIRPISKRPSEEVSEEERRYENGKDPQLLDVVRIPMIEPRPKSHQSENHLIDDGYYWRRVKRGSWEDAIDSVDDVLGPLWANGHSSYNGINDRVPKEITKTLDGSLFLITPEDLKIQVVTEGAEFGEPRRRVRATFKLNNQTYKLAVTDPQIEREFLRGENGTYPIESALLCISLGELWEGYAYKLVAAMITPERVRLLK